MIITNTNGNGTVSIDLSTGTKVRQVNGDKYLPDYPETIDLKITNYCDAGCGFCHESSTVKGKHADLEDLKAQLSDLPPYTELAIGGGNPLSHPELISFLRWCRSKNFIANITVNHKHVEYISDEIKQLVYGIGISVSTSSKEFKLVNANNVVYHVIAGIHDPNDVFEFFKEQRILVLGYKHYGLGIKYFSQQVDDSINKWIHQLPQYLKKYNYQTISFDNLALEQLKIKRLVSAKTWQTLYMGDDFTASMYIDAVKKEFSPTSRSNNRVNWSQTNLWRFFHNVL